MRPQELARGLFLRAFWQRSRPTNYLLSIRTHPLEHVYRETYKTIINLRNSNMSAQDRVDERQQS